MNLKLPQVDGIRAVVLLSLLIATSLSCAADAFVPPNAADIAVSEREQARDDRIGRLEKAIASVVDALERSEKGKGDAKGEEIPKAAGVSVPVPMPSPLVRAHSTQGGRPEVAFPIAQLPEVERVIGIVNGEEIYVIDGVVRRREVVLPSPASVGGRK